MLESPAEYISNHHITGWYHACQEYTFETVFASANSDFALLTKQLQWPAYFVKDYVKFLTTSRGSVAHSAAEITEIVKQIAHFRGEIEGGIGVRQFEKLVENSEQRYFVLNGQPFSADNHIPAIVSDIVNKISTPFFTIDVVKNSQGELRLIEIGDGQVSDIKEWAIDKLVALFCAYNN